MRTLVTLSILLFTLFGFLACEEDEMLVPANEQGTTLSLRAPGEAITDITSDKVVAVGTTEIVDVSYQAATDRTVKVVLQNERGSLTYGSGELDVAAGTGTARVPVNVNDDIPVAEDAYKFQVFLARRGEDWGTRVADAKQIDVTAVAGGSESYPDEIVAINAAEAVVAGKTETITVDYTSSEDRDVILVLQRINGGDTFGADNKPVVAGSGRLTFEISVDPEIPPATNAYKYVAFITPRGRDYPDKIDLLEKRPISAGASSDDGGGGDPGNEAENPSWRANLSAAGARGFGTVDANVLRQVIGSAPVNPSDSTLRHLALGQDNLGWYLRQRIEPTRAGSDVVQFGIPVPEADELVVAYTLELENSWYLYDEDHCNRFRDCIALGPYPRWGDGGYNTRGGKLPGPAFGDLNYASGNRPTGGRGGSARIMYRELSSASPSRNGESGFCIYEYSTAYTGRDTYTTTGTPTPQQPGRSYEVLVHVKMNSPGQSNGFTRFYIDGALEAERTGIRWGNGSQKWGYFWYSVFAGGNNPSWAPGGTTYLKVRNMRTARTPADLSL